MQNVSKDNVILVKRSIEHASMISSFDIKLSVISSNYCLHTLTQMIHQSNPNLKNCTTFLFHLFKRGGIFELLDINKSKGMPLHPLY